LKASPHIYPIMACPLQLPIIRLPLGCFQDIFHLVDTSMNILNVTSD
jgi:hypothetical protein